MKYFKLVLPIFLVLFISTHCKRDEPFEYPEDPQDVDPSWITETQRVISDGENWVPMQSADGCNPNLPIGNLAYQKLDYERGFATINLTPDTTSCEVEVSLTSDFKTDEISTHGWDELTFEFTFSEYKANSGVELWISLYYKNLELDLNLVPIIEQLIPADTTDGLVKLHFVDDNPYFELNGKEFSPEFSAKTGNHLTLSGTGAKQYFSAKMHSSEVDVQSYLVFKFLRISRYGLKDT
ncbi:MAG: hypothetical protein R2813_02520 [Flavobacteriales bacterium]